MKRLTLGLVGAAALLTLWACGGSSNDDTCEPGTTKACVGDKGCSGKKLCDADGSDYGACMCSHSGGGGAGGGDTSSGGSDVGGDPNFLPNDLSGLSLWLEADLGVEEDVDHPGQVLAWHDHSKYQQVATTGGAPFVFFTNDNGNTVIGCPGGAALTMHDLPPIEFGTGNFTVAMVIEDVSDAAETAFWSKDVKGDKTFDFITGINGKWQLDIGGVSAPIPKPSRPGYHLVMFRRDPKTDIVIDGADYQGPAVGSDLDAIGTPLTLCAPAAGVKSNAIAAVIAVQGASTDADIANLNGYLVRKYGL